MRVILASQSPRRIELLRMIGIEAEVRPSDIEEKIQYREPQRVVEDLAVQKARDVWGRLEEHRDSILIAADTVVSVDDKILGKPRDEKEAFQMLSEISGREHSVYTGVSLFHEAGNTCFFEESKVRISAMTNEEIQAYICTGEPLDKAGAYGIQGRFAKFVERIEGDYYNVVGLPLARLYQELKRVGISLG